MNRREVLALAALSTAVSGCLASDPVDSGPDTTTETQTDTPTPTPTDTATPSPTATDDCQWPTMCEGSQLVEVAVKRGFAGDVTLEANCRGETYGVEPGESVRIDRHVDGERCRIALTVDGETVYSEDLPDYKRVTLTVAPNGEVDVEAIVY